MRPPAGRAAAERRPIAVLFVCNGNSARSQMGEALLGRFGGEDFRRGPAGTRPKSVHPMTVQVLAEIGIDWRGARAKSVSEMLDQPFDYVITLSNTAREECPAFPGRMARCTGTSRTRRRWTGATRSASRRSAPRGRSSRSACAHSSRSPDAPPATSGRRGRQWGTQ